MLPHTPDGATVDARALAAMAVVVEQASAEAHSALREAGIRSILLKGPLQQAWLAAAGAGRASSDVDLLVDPADADAAGAVFRSLGYRLEPEVTPGVDHHGDLWAAPPRVPVEVHWSLSGTDPTRTFPVLAEETEAAGIAGQTVEVPTEPARCLIVALHAAQHGADVRGPLYDLERAVAVAHRSSWERAVQLAHAVGAEAEFVTGLGLVPAGERLRGELGLRALPLTERLAMNLATPVAGEPGFYWLARQPGIRAQARYVARKLAPPADFMRFKYPWARRGAAHLALAYLYRLLWIARWAVPGFLAWRRARAAARSSAQQHR